MACESMNKHHQTISKTLHIREKQISATAALLDEGATVPFVARYRKEATGSLDEMQISAIRDQLVKLTKPGRDPRALFEVFSFAGGVKPLMIYRPA